MSLVAARSETAFASATDAAPQIREAGRILRGVRQFIRVVSIRRQRQVLQQLPDWMLKDVGIDRSDIDSVAIHLVDGQQDPTRRREPR